LLGSGHRTELAGATMLRGIGILEPVEKEPCRGSGAIERRAG